MTRSPLRSGHTAILLRLDSLRPRLRRSLLLFGAAEVGLALAAAALASFALDWLLELPLLARILFFMLSASACVILLRRARRRLQLRYDMEDLAAAVEASEESLDGHLANVLELPAEIRRLEAAPGAKVERGLLERALRESSERAARVRMGGSIRLFPVIARAGLAALAGGVLAIAAARAPEAFGLWFRRNVLFASEPWPRKTHFRLDRPEIEWHHARKDPLEIAGWVTGEIPRQVELRLEARSERRDVLLVPGVAGRVFPAAPAEDAPGATGPAGKSGDAVEGRRLVHVVQAVMESFRFHLEGGDNQSEVVTVHVHDRPRILAARFTLRYPAYLELEPRTVENPGGDLAVPAGTEIDFSAEADQDIASGWFHFGAGERVPAAVSGKAITGSLTPAENGFLDAAVTSAEWGLESEPPLRVAVVVLPDRSPSVGLEIAGEARVMTPRGRVAYRVAAADDHGFSALDLNTLRRVRGDSTPEEELKPTATPLEGRREKVEGGVRASVEGELDLAQLTVQPGDTLTLQAFVADNDTVGGPKTATSQKETIVIVDPEELRKEMERVRLEAQAALEDLVRREEEVSEKLLAWEPQDELADPSEPAAAEAGEPAAGARSKGSKKRGAGSKGARSAPAKSASSPSPGDNAEASAASDPESEPSAADAASGAQPKSAGASPGRKASASSRQSGAQKAGAKGASKSAKDAARQGAEETANLEPEPAAGENADSPRTGEEGAGRPESQPQEGSREQGPRPARRPTLSDLGREQSRIGKDAAEVSNKLEDMAETMRRNELLNAAEESRFQDEVAEPLREVAEERLPESASEIQAADKAEKPSEAAARAQKEADKLSRDMRRVAERLAGSGDFREILQRLEIIIDLQRKTIGETEKKVPAQKEGSRDASF